MFVDGMVSIGASGFLSGGANGVYPASIQATATVSGIIGTDGTFSATLTAPSIDAGLNGSINLSANLTGSISGQAVVAGAVSGQLMLTGSIDTNANLFLAPSGSLTGMAGLSFSGAITAAVQVNGGLLTAGAALTVSGPGALGSLGGPVTGTMANNVSAPVQAPPYPTVANLPGTPKVVAAPQSAGATALPVATLSAAVPPSVHINTSYPGWAIYDITGTPLVVPDQFRAIRHHQASKVVSNTIEKGSYATWNKILEPGTIAVTMAKNSSLAERQAFEKALLAAQGSLVLYAISHPENTYVNYTLEWVESGKRGPDQAYSSEIECFFREIREFASTYGDMTNAQGVTAAPTANQGQVTATAAPANVAGVIPTSP